MNDFVIVFLIPTFTAYAQCMGAGAIGCGLLFVEHWWKTKRQIRDELAAETEAALLEQGGPMHRDSEPIGKGDMVTMGVDGYVKAGPTDRVVGVAISAQNNSNLEIVVPFKTGWQ